MALVDTEPGGGGMRITIEPHEFAKVVARIQVGDELDCWLWTGSVNPKGYGVHSVYRRPKMRSTPAHRAAYQALVGPIADDREIDHLCRTRLCCNPSHMEVVTHGENVRRGDMHKVGAVNAAKMHCPQGHAYEGENIYWHDNKRHCLTCRTRRGSARVA